MVHYPWVQFLSNPISLPKSIYIHSLSFSTREVGGAIAAPPIPAKNINTEIKGRKTFSGARVHDTCHMLYHYPLHTPRKKKKNGKVLLTIEQLSIYN